jgi:serine/threonine protein kinase
MAKQLPSKTIPDLAGPQPADSGALTTEPGLSPADKLTTAMAPPLPGARQADVSPVPRSAGGGPLAPFPAVPGYEVLGELGRGGMGVVYKARQKSLNRLVALKMVHAGRHADPDDLARFRREAESVARLQHPLIVQIHEVGEHYGLQYFSLELVEGPSLRHRLAGNPQPARVAARLVEILARTVHFAHQRGIVHRDLKPDNVLLAPPPASEPPTDADTTQVAARFGVPKITDFGLAKRLDEESGQTRTGQVMGTPNYMAPEQAAGNKDVGPAADVWALGAILYECLTGRPPFKGTGALDTVWQVINEEPVPPGRLCGKLPRDLERVCLKCLHKAPGQRYASALELADDLRRHLQGEPVRARPASAPGRLWRWSQRNPVAASLLLAISLGSVFGLWYLSRLSQSLVESAAQDSAAQLAEVLEEVNDHYSTVVDGVKRQSYRIKSDPQDRDKEKKVVDLPFPAEFTIQLGQRLRRNDSGTQVRLFSDYRFHGSTNPGPQDDFEKQALRAFRADSKLPFYSRLDSIQGRPVLRYAKPRIMSESCVRCHNTHPRSPRKDWQPGDVRGVLAILRPLDQDEARIRKGLHGTLILVGAIGASLLTLSGLVLFLGKRRRRLPASPQP